MYTYAHLTNIPEPVRKAHVMAQNLGFDQSCTNETGRFLRALASQIRTGTIGEIGTGCGVGSAWMASALAPGVRLVTVELDETRAKSVQALFRTNSAVTVLPGDWRQLQSYAPFAMLFVDGGNAKELDADECVDLTHVRGVIVLDDLTPLDMWPAEWQGKLDRVRDFWLNEPRLVATEIRVSATMSVLLATRIG